MNRLTFRLFLAFSFILVTTLFIMWVALLLVLRANSPNTDSETIELAAILVESTGVVIDQYTVVRIENRENQATDNNGLEPGERLRDRFDTTRVTADMIFRQTLEEQAELNDVRFLLLRDDNCVIWDTDPNAEYPRLLPQDIENESFLDTERRLGTDLYKGSYQETNGSVWLFVALPRVGILNQVLTANLGTLILRNTDAVCGITESEESTSSISLIAAQTFPEHTIGTILDEYEGDGIFLALFQAVIIGLFFAFVASFMFVRWISHPLDQISHTAGAIAAGDYSQRTAISGPHELRLTASAFNQMVEQVEITQQAQRDFLANVSHDLKTPLTSIQGFAQAIYEGVAEGQQAQKSAEIIESEALRMNRMVNDLLELARIQSGRLEMMRSTIDIQRILETVGRSLQIKAQQKSVTLHVDIPRLPHIAGDGDRLAQVFTNLTDNAIKHTASHGEVWLRAETNNTGIQIEVEDTGEGIPAEDISRIFERFYQVDKSRAKRQGTGLGLAISKEIVDAHGGRITVESEVNRGTTFTVWLPQPHHDPGDTVINKRH